MQTIRKGNRGEAVKQAQTLLNAKGYHCGTVDGIFGVKTDAATRTFQKANGLSVDGIIGKNTWAALQAAQTEEPKTEHFERREFDCHNGVKVPEQYYGNLQRIMNELEKVRAIWGKPIIIRSGFRTLEYNRAIGNTTDHSQHLTANAADIMVSGVAASIVYNKLNEMYPNDGVGKYPDFTHLDLRGVRARW